MGTHGRNAMEDLNTAQKILEQGKDITGKLPQDAANQQRMLEAKKAELQLKTAEGLITAVTEMELKFTEKLGQILQSETFSGAVNDFSKAVQDMIDLIPGGKGKGDGTSISTIPEYNKFVRESKAGEVNDNRFDVMGWWDKLAGNKPIKPSIDPINKRQSGE
jgi:hypothetical protein